LPRDKDDLSFGDGEELTAAEEELAAMEYLSELRSGRGPW
jgi:hypothetical protein